MAATVSPGSAGPSGVPRPLMFVPRDLDHKWIGNYMKKKYLALCHFIGKPETTCLYYSLADFTNLMDRISAVGGVGGVKLYFASYCPTGNPAIDKIAHAGWMDQLTIVFGATDSGRNDLGHYFTISPLGGLIDLTPQTATSLVKSYQMKKMPFLTAIIRDAGVDGFQETKSYWFPIVSFNGPHGIIQEMHATGATGITAFIGSYGDAELTPSQVDVSYQMNVIFELATSIQHDGGTYSYHFDLENTPGWSDRPAPPPSPTARLQGGDTGNPCPPAICGTSLI